LDDIFEFEFLKSYKISGDDCEKMSHCYLCLV